MLFMMQGQQVVDDVGRVARVAAPMVAYFSILWTGTFTFCRVAGMRYGHAVTQARAHYACRAAGMQNRCAVVQAKTVYVSWTPIWSEEGASAR